MEDITNGWIKNRGIRIWRDQKRRNHKWMDQNMEGSKMEGSNEWRDQNMERHENRKAMLTRV